MFKTYKFKTYCKGESYSSKTANIIDERPYVFKRNRIQIQVNGFWLEQLISLNLKTNSGGGGKVTDWYSRWFCVLIFL